MKRILLLLILVALKFCVHAQRLVYSFNRISMDDGIGLQSNKVYSLYQDKNGFIWLGTSNGLQRFDGGKFVTFNPRGTKINPMPDVAIEQILPADSGRMWLSAYSIRQFGIFNFSDFSYTAIPLQTSGPIPARAEFRMWQDSSGHTYLNILRYGKILEYKPDKRAFTEETPLNNLPPGWKSLLKVHYDHRNRQYWILCDSGLAVYDAPSRSMWTRYHHPASLALLDRPELQQGLSELYIDSKRRHWIFYWTSQQNFRCYDSTGQVFLTDTAGLGRQNTSYAELSEFRETSNGTLWVYGLANLYSQDDGKQFTLHRSQYLDNYQIRYDHVYQVLEDKDRFIWIATDQGLYYTSAVSNRIANIYLSNLPGFVQSTDLIELKNGGYWVSTWGHGVITMDSNFKPGPSPLYNNLPPLDEVSRVSYRQIWAMCQHSVTGKVYLGCQRGQLMVYDPSNGETKYLHPPEFDNRTIRYITEDHSGNLWFGTQGGRLLSFDGNRFRVIQDFGAGAIIFKILVDTEGLAWICTQDLGLFAVHTGSGLIVQHYKAGEGTNRLYAGTCNDVEQLNDSLLYVANSALAVINKKRKSVELLSVFDGLPSNSIKKIRLDRKGHLWTITDNGLCRYDRGKKLFTTYGKKDGILLGSVVNSADHLCSNDYVMFTGTNSLLYFHPDVFRNTEPPPNVTITDFQLGDSYIPVDSLLGLREITLAAGQNYFQVSFASVDFRNREKFIYYYKLEGQHKDWIKAESMDIIFAGIQPGRYRLLLKAENLEGQVSKAITELRFRIKPPFWRSGWFISTVLFFLALLAWYIYILRQKRKAERETIRNRIARDLHDDMGSTLSTINILSSMARSKLTTEPAKTGEFLSKIGDNSQRMMEAMDDIVWAIKPDNDNMQRIVARMREFSTSVLEARDIDLSFSCDEAVNGIKLDMEQRRDLFLFFKEAINNIAKYSKCSHAVVRLGIHQHRLVLEVEDDGIGFDVQKADSGNGLGNMQKRADSLRGRFQLRSQPGKGTGIQLNMQLT